MTKPLPIGISDFKRMIEEGYAYVDKTLLIQELVEKGTVASFIPRLRRFGKTLNLSMLRYFFEKTEEDHSFLFSSLRIWKDEKCRALQGKFPVIFLSLKDVKQASWEQTYEIFRRVVAAEFRRHKYLLEGDTLDEEEKEDYRKILRKEDDQALIEQSLLLLTEWLHRYHGQRVVLLIDEYDAPAHAAYVGEYYDTLISFLRNWLSAGLKDNGFLERGVLTGILRIAKESIFSGLNNISTFTLLSETFGDKFGLLEDEVEALLQEFDLAHKLPEIRQWYDGYRIGSCEGIYNPWSVLKCIEANGQLTPYWVNTSDNALIKQLITKGSYDLKMDVEELLRGGYIEKTIEEGIVFSDLEKNADVVWSLFLFSGYVTVAGSSSYGTPCKMQIPNVEVEQLFKSIILGWFKSSIVESEYHLLLQSLISGDVDTFSQLFQKFILSSVSVFDVGANEPEKIYHAFVLGLLIGLHDKYEVKSNRESGYGRYDVMLIPKNPKELGIILEFKKMDVSDRTDLAVGVEAALKQIEDKQYARELLDRGVGKILSMGLAFQGKKVLIRCKSTSAKT